MQLERQYRVEREEMEQRVLSVALVPWSESAWAAEVLGGALKRMGNFVRWVVGEVK